MMYLRKYDNGISRIYSLSRNKKTNTDIWGGDIGFVNEIADFCSKEFERATKVKLKVGETKKVKAINFVFEK
jgi:hypothetical protein